MITRWPLAALAAITLAACAQPDTPETPTPEPVPPTVTTVTEPDGPTVAPPTESVRALAVPNVVGMEHQEAQDTLQAAGFYYLTEEDATGQGRLLVSDRNWIVVSQEPPAGTVIPQTDRILLRSKKKTDP